MKRVLLSSVWAVALAAMAGLLGGCASLSQPAGASFASVVIASGTEEQVREETIKVFVAENWKNVRSSGSDLVFEREGSKYDYIAYGSAVHETPILNRVRAQMVPLADGSLRLQCQAYVVRDSGGMGMDDEIRLHAPRAGTYRQLLDKVAAHFIGLEKK